MQQDGFTNHGTKLRKQLCASFRAQSCSGRVGVKGQDERQTAPPLTPTRPLREISRRFTLTGADAVIHGIPRTSTNTPHIERRSSFKICVPERSRRICGCSCCCLSRARLAKSSGFSRACPVSVQRSPLA